MKETAPATEPMKYGMELTLEVSCPPSACSTPPDYSVGPPSTLA